MEKHKTARYLKYAIGEIVLVVIGILIALQINNWNEGRKTKIDEVKLLNQIHESLNLEISDLRHNIEAIEETINSIAIIRKHLENDLPYNDSLSTHFGLSAKSVGYIIKPTAYEKLKSTGLDLITNDSLRNTIVTHYDYFTSYLKDIEQIIVFNHQNLIIEPIMLKKFDYSWFLKPAVPNNYEELKSDTEYLSLLKTNSEIRSFQLQRTKALLNSAFELQTDIEIELRK
ncbi:DUF6090 family protein [Aegicerativicinus sediminis]